MHRTLLVLLVVAVASCRSPERPRRLNVLLVTIDTLRNDHCSFSGYARPTTPNLEALVRSGTRMALAYTPTATTGPAHASLFTSRYPLTHGVLKNGMPLRAELHTLAETLQAAGYDTSAVVSSFVLDAKFGYNQGFAAFDDDFDPRWTSITRSEFEGQEVEGAFDQRANETTRKALAELERLGRGVAPFLLWVHYFDPHAPYDPPEPWASRFAQAGTGDALQRQIDAYDGEIAFVDDMLGRLVVALRERRLEDDTLVVVTADHGEGLMQHGHMNHGVNIYEEAVRIPLLFHLQGRIAANRVLDQAVEIVDIMPTVLDLVGVAVSEAPHGRSLAAVLGGAEDKEAERSVYLYRRHYTPGSIRGMVVAGEKFGIRRGRWKYIEGAEEGTRELFDLSADPAESNNLYETTRDVANELAARLTEWRAAHFRDSATTIELSPQDRERLKALGYVE